MQNEIEIHWTSTSRVRGELFYLNEQIAELHGRRWDQKTGTYRTFGLYIPFGISRGICNQGQDLTVEACLALAIWNFERHRNCWIVTVRTHGVSGVFDLLPGNLIGLTCETLAEKNRQTQEAL